MHFKEITTDDDGVMEVRKVDSVKTYKDCHSTFQDTTVTYIYFFRFPLSFTINYKFAKKDR